MIELFADPIGKNCFKVLPGLKETRGQDLRDASFS